MADSIFRRMLSPERVAAADLFDKDEAMERVLDLLTTASEVTDASALREAILARESAMPTGMGFGLGAPHVRHWSTSAPVGALLVIYNPIDYGSMDSEPVQALFAVALPEESHHEWLLCLAELSERFRLETFRKKLYQCQSSEEIWELVSQ